MLFKPSKKTNALMKRGAWLFLPLWCGTVAYIWLTSEGIISKSWDTAFFAVFMLLFAVNFAHMLVALNSARKDATRSQHPDPDVAALIDGEIDLKTYGERKRGEDAANRADRERS